jgi:aldehyde dehydrogenase (NAD+)
MFTATSQEVKDIAEAYKSLQGAFASNKSKSYQWRYAQLAAIKQFLKDYETQLSDALNADLGRHHFEAVALDLLPCTVECDLMMNNLKTWMEPTYTDVPLWMAPATSEIVHEPYGVTLIMGAFNYPVILTVKNSFLYSANSGAMSKLCIRCSDVRTA